MIDSAVIDLPEPDLPASKRLAGGDVEGEMLDDHATPLGGRDLGDQVTDGKDGGGCRRVAESAHTTRSKNRRKPGSRRAIALNCKNCWERRIQKGSKERWQQ